MLPVFSRAVLASVTSVASMASAASVVSVPAVALPAVSVSAPPPVRAEDRPAGVGDRLTVIVRHAGAGRNGTYVVSCHPAVGSHPDVAGACRAVDRSTRWGREAFAPVAPGSVCTMVYGGPATAHVTGTWAGRPVDATYDRSNGCEIARWNRMVPLLPDIRS